MDSQQDAMTHLEGTKDGVIDEHERESNTIPLGALNVGYSVPRSPLANPDEAVSVLEGLMTGGSGWTSGGRTLPGTICENSNDSCSVGPVTPQRAVEHNPGTPLTPLANLKMLIAAASTALDREKEIVSATREEAGPVDESSGRKMKSLAVLCKRFLAIVESDIGEGNEFSLDMMSQSLGTNRRRIYDIINVLESLEMIVKQSKNWYSWTGRSSLTHTLAKLRAMALDDNEFCSLFVSQDKENSNLTCKGEGGGVERKALQPLENVSMSAAGGGEDLWSGDQSDLDSKTGGGRWDKSLGVLCQKFVMLFLVSPVHEVTLEFAGHVLMPDDLTGQQLQSSTTHKSKVRRLYDIANVLTTLGLIKKKTFMAPNHRKMPGYSWSGPTIEEIQAISVSRKVEAGVGSLYPAKKGVPLTRKPSFSNRPFLHQYEVQCKDEQGLSTATAKEKSSRRSLSFGGDVSHTSLSPVPPASSTASCVVARPLSQKQLDVMNEVKEFEAEMQKHVHRYPHVASIFQEFIKKYRSTLEQSSVGGRILLPKTVAPTSPAFSSGTLELVAKTILSSPNISKLVAGSSMSPSHPALPTSSVRPEIPSIVTSASWPVVTNPSYELPTLLTLPLDLRQSTSIRDDNTTSPTTAAVAVSEESSSAVQHEQADEQSPPSNVSLCPSSKGSLALTVTPPAVFLGGNLTTSSSLTCSNTSSIPLSQAWVHHSPDVPSTTSQADINKPPLSFTLLPNTSHQFTQPPLSTGAKVSKLSSITSQPNLEFLNLEQFMVPMTTTPVHGVVSSVDMCTNATSCVFYLPRPLTATPCTDPPILTQAKQPIPATVEDATIAENALPSGRLPTAYHPSYDMVNPNVFLSGPPLHCPPATRPAGYTPVPRYNPDHAHPQETGPSKEKEISPSKRRRLE